jgi:AraC family transcriptional regulator, L-rhamnose operon transcriptional activator RhaR
MIGDSPQMDEYFILKGEDYFKNNIPIYLNIAPGEYRNASFLHKHDFIEIAYVNSGKGIHVIGNEEYEVSKGDLCIINYDIPHVFIQDVNNTEGNLINYNCVFKPEFIDYSLIHTNDFKGIASSLLFNTFFIEDKPVVSLKLSGAFQAEIEELFRKMQQEFFTMRNGYVNILRSCLIELLTKIFRFLEEEQSQAPKSVNYKSKIMSKAFDFLKENYHSSALNINEVAVKTFLSRSYFSRLFKETTGQNFSEYLQNLRISEACTLLKTTDKKITEILSDVGFNDVKHFNQLFKKITGKTPSEYRKS